MSTPSLHNSVPVWALLNGNVGGVCLYGECHRKIFDSDDANAPTTSKCCVLLTGLVQKMGTSPLPLLLTQRKSLVLATDGQFPPKMEEQKSELPMLSHNHDARGYLLHSMSLQAQRWRGTKNT